MMRGFPELVIGGVLVAPFAAYAAAALALYLVSRPILRSLGAYGLFSAAPIVEVCFYVLILAALLLLF